MDLHDTHQGSVEVISFWFFCVEDLHIVGPSWDAEDLAIEEVTGELAGL